MKTYIALISTTALRDTQLYIGPAAEISWDGQWDDIQCLPAYIGIFSGAEDKVREAAARDAGCAMEFIELIPVDKAVNVAKRA